MLGDAAHPTVVLLKSEAVTGDAALERNAKAEGALVRRLGYKGCPSWSTGSRVSPTRAPS